MPTPTGPLSDPHLSRLRETLVPGRREIDLTPYELRALLDEVEFHRIPPIDLDEPTARTRTIPTPEVALAQYRSMIEANTADLPDLEEGALWVYPLALGFFLGLGLTLETARHLSIRV